MGEIPEIDFVEAIARQAGAIIAEQINKPQTISTKLSLNDLVTETDVSVETTLKSLIALKYPTHKFLCEESVGEGQRLTHEPTWIIDPIDGTTNFCHRLPWCCVSIGFAINKEPVVGCIYAPVLEEMFSASKGKGAFCNGKRINVSMIGGLSWALVATCASATSHQKLKDTSITAAEKTRHEYITDTSAKLICRIVRNAQDLRRMGSTALELAHMAAGRLDVVVQIGPKEWDVAAGIVIIREAGGIVTDFDGNEDYDWTQHRILAASSRPLAQECVQHLTTDIPLYNRT